LGFLILSLSLRPSPAFWAPVAFLYLGCCRSSHSKRPYVRNPTTKIFWSPSDGLLCSGFLLFSLLRLPVIHFGLPALPCTQAFAALLAVGDNRLKVSGSENEHVLVIERWSLVLGLFAPLPFRRHPALHFGLPVLLYLGSCRSPRPK